MKMKLKLQISMIFFMILVLTVTATLPPASKVDATNEAELVSSYPEQNAEYVPITSEITLQFDNTISFLNKNSIKIFSQRKLAPFIEEQNLIEEIEIIKDRRGRENTLLITFRENLKIDHNYKLTIAKYGLNFPNRNFRNDFELNFSTSSYRFEEVMSGSVTKEILEDYAPRQIKVVTPKKYIETIDVIHKKSGAMTDNDREKQTNAVTNIDVKTIGIDVNHIRVIVWDKEEHSVTTYMKHFDSTNSDVEQTFHLGLADLPETFDLQIIVYNRFSETIESKRFKVPAGENPIFNIKETFEYDTDGQVFSLYELMADADLFNDVLLEHDTFPLKIQLKEE